ncbi:MAG: ABC transporter substrate-binding protein [Sciscionella sp.]
MLIAAFAGACGSSSGPSAASSSSGQAPIQEWVQGIVSPKGDSGFVFMAQQQGFYKKQGVKVTYQKFTGNVQLIQALIAGSIDSASSAPGTVIDADLKGANLKIIGSTTPKLIDVVIAKDSIKSLKQLQGKTIGTSAPHALPDTMVHAMLAKQGLDPKTIHTVNAGNDAQRFKALAAGRIDAAEESPDFIPQMKGKPLHVLATVQDVVPFFTHHLIVVNGNSLKKKPEAAVRFLAGTMQGVDYATHHRQAEINLAAQKLQEPPSAPALAYDYDAIMKAHAASPTSEIPTAEIKQLQQFRVKDGFQKAILDPSKLIDPTVRQKALKLAHISN